MSEGLVGLGALGGLGLRGEGGGVFGGGDWRMGRVWAVFGLELGMEWGFRCYWVGRCNLGNKLRYC